MRLPVDVDDRIEVQHGAPVVPRRGEGRDQPGIEVAQQIGLQFDDIGHGAARSRFRIGVNVECRHQKDRKSSPKIPFSSLKRL
jgi:hypothetical protein